jgi:signal transduction histidine kinase
VQARSDLLAIVSHDLRNPLHVIRMATSVLQRSDALPEEHRLQAAHRILRAADGMNRLIEDLLAASKIESGTFSVDRRNPESIESLLSDAVELFVEVAAAKSVSLEKRLGGAPASVSCDRGRVLQVFSNLIGNALKFTPPGGTVTISADQIADEARFAVCDTGPGIPEAQRTAVFSRYWQAKKGDGGGTGLGLYIVKGIVEAHGGKVWIDSGPEGGACVRFTLPLAHVRRSPDVAPAQRLLKRTT